MHIVLMHFPFGPSNLFEYIVFLFLLLIIFSQKVSHFLYVLRSFPQFLIAISKEISNSDLDSFISNIIDPLFSTHFNIVENELKLRFISVCFLLLVLLLYFNYNNIHLYFIN